jgi:hypothetical protein
MVPDSAKQVSVYFAAGFQEHPIENSFNRCRHLLRLIEER